MQKSSIKRLKSGLTIANILLKTGITTTIYDAINVFENGYSSGLANSPLAQTYIWPEQYWDEITDERGDCYTVLSEILKKYGATVRYSYGHWYLLRPNTDTACFAKVSARSTSSITTNSSLVCIL